jgi:hypothetical protein
MTGRACLGEKRRDEIRPRRRAWAADAFIAVRALGFKIDIGLKVTAKTRHALAAPSGLATAAGQLAGLTGSYLLVVMPLSSRGSLAQGVLGQDRLVRCHRRLGPWPIVLSGANAVQPTQAIGRPLTVRRRQAVACAKAGT